MERGLPHGDAARRAFGWPTRWNQPYFGESHFVGPNGRVPNVSTHANLIIADLELAQLAAGDPAGWNLPRDIRHDIYSPRRRPVRRERALRSGW